ncbi:MAG: aminotransferase class V-fold PLP-dependent enzyme [Streptosporangiales bacterium]|nr:aminotransferase class V-fold PLP-dependent enzyme [Streptosporangiales bacterium]
MSRLPGRRLLQIPGPTNVPGPVLDAIARPTIDHRSAEFAALMRGLLPDLARVFGTSGPVVIYPSSGTGAWEAALANTLSPGDRVLGFETGYFATLWADMARRLGLVADLVPGDWRHGVEPSAVRERLRADPAIKAVCVVHNETSTGVLSRVREVRAAIDAGAADRGADPPLLFVDTVSSLACTDYRHDEWGVDVTVSGSQKGLMLPPGLGFNAISERALAAAETARLPRSYWDWRPVLEANAAGFYPYTPATNLLFGLRAAVDLLCEEGLANVFARHARHSAATRAAVDAWGLEVVCRDQAEHSPSLTAVLMPEGYDEAEFRAAVVERYGMALGSGLGRLRGRVFRIGHLGDFDDLMLAATLSGVELGLAAAGVPYRPGGVAAALEVLAR